MSQAAFQSYQNKVFRFSGSWLNKRVTPRQWWRTSALPWVTLKQSKKAAAFTRGSLLLLIRARLMRAPGRLPQASTAALSQRTKSLGGHRNAFQPHRSQVMGRWEACVDQSPPAHQSDGPLPNARLILAQSWREIKTTSYSRNADADYGTMWTFRNSCFLNDQRVQTLI